MGMKARVNNATIDQVERYGPGMARVWAIKKPLYGRLVLRWCLSGQYVAIFCLIPCNCRKIIVVIVRFPLAIASSLVKKQPSVKPSNNQY